MPGVGEVQCKGQALKNAWPHQVSPATSWPSRRATWYGPEFSCSRLLPLRVGIVPGRPKAKVRWLPTSADTAHAPKKMVRARTKASTTENVSVIGICLEKVKLPPLLPWA